MASFKRLFLYAAVLVLNSVCCGAASADGILAPAATALSMAKREQLQADPLVIRARAAQLDGDQLFRPSAWSAPLDLNLFPDVELKAHVTSAKSLENGSKFLYGTLGTGGHFSLFRHRSGILRGEFHSAQGVYSVRSEGKEGRILVTQNDPSVLPGCGVTESSNAQPSDERPADGTDKWVYLDVDRPKPAQLPEQQESEPVDVLVLYTQRVEDHEGGPSQVQATIEHRVAQTNQYLENSLLPHRQIRLAATEKVDYVQTDEGLLQDLRRLSRSSEDGLFDHVGYDDLDEVFPMIEEHEADLVHLFVRDSNPCGFAKVPSDHYGDAIRSWHGCGSAYNHALCVLNLTQARMQGDRFSVSAIKCGPDAVTFAHELGHTMSLGHNRWDVFGSLVDVLDPSPLRGFNSGYTFGHSSPEDIEGIGQGTIMGVSRERVPYFSNPNLYFPEPRNSDVPWAPRTPMGVAGDQWVTGYHGPVNAARSLDHVWDFVAALSDPPMQELPGACNGGDVPRDAIASHRVVFGPGGGRKDLVFSASSEKGECMDDVFLRMGWPLGDVHWNEGRVVPLKTTSGYNVSAEEVREGQWRVSMSAVPHFQSCEATKSTIAIAELWDDVQMRNFGRLSHRVPGVRPGFVRLDILSSHSFCRGAPTRHLRSLGDFDGDGRVDILLRHADGRWLLYAPQEQELLAGPGPVGRLTQNPAVEVSGVGDFNGDGRDDLLMRHRNGSWRYYPIDGHRSVPGNGGVALPDDAWVEGIGDFNRDGKDDVLLRHKDGLWRVHLMDGRTVREGGSASQSRVSVYTRNAGWVAGIGDFNGDGGDDVLFRRVEGTWHYHPYPFYSAIGTADHFEGGGEVELAKDLEWAMAGVADFNGDGKDDVLLRHADGRWRYYAMDGRAIVEEVTPTGLPAEPMVWLAGVGDVDGDGKADVVARRAHGSWSVYRMDGGHVVDEAEVDLASETGWGVLKGGAVAPVEIAVPLSMQPLALGTDAMLDLSAHFADDQAIAYEVHSTDGDVVRASVTGSALTLMPVAIGRTVVTVIARDSDGNATVQSFTVVVTEDGTAGAATDAGTNDAQRGFLDCVDCPEMVVVPAGSFMMGAPADEIEGSPDERPVHRVDFARPFAIGKYEVTVREWRACEAAGRCYRQSCNLDGEYCVDYVVQGAARQPAIFISWNDAQEFLAWLSEHSSEDYRLPSEAEWEYAARAGTETAFHFGDGISLAEASYGSTSTAEVGSFPSNEWGLHDVHGNATEWTQDCWNADYVGAPTDGGAWETGECELRVFRGGSGRRRTINGLRSAERGAYPPFGQGVLSGYYFGLRVARAVSPLQALSTPIPAQFLSLGTPQTLNLAAHFGNQTLDYEVRSSDARVVHAVVVGSTLALGAVSPGRAAITVTARDGDGNTATQAFPVEVWLRDCAECPAMVVVPAGTFTMGAPESEPDSYDIERPQRTVSVPSFAAGAFEVTFDEWNACVADGGCDGYRPDDRGWGQGRRPVVDVSWQHAQRYVEWLSQRSGHRYRLLSEAEWEYAARAGTETPFHTGETITEQQANFDGNHGQTAPVGSYAPNAFGLHDVHGNLMEWVQDCYTGYDAEGARVDGGPVEGADGCSRVLRGGSWAHPSSLIRAAVRVFQRDDYPGHNGYFGFRVARAF